MLESYLYKKYLESKKENLKENKSSNSTFSSNVTNLFNLVVMCISLYFFFECNKRPSLSLLWAVCCPYCYIFYHLANTDRCVVSEVTDAVADAPAAPVAPEAPATPAAPADQFGGAFDTSSISSLGF